MYVRQHKRKKNGKEHTYWSLVESYRTAKGSRNRTVAYLGEIEESARKGWVNFSRAIDGNPLLEHTLPLFLRDDDEAKQEPVAFTVEVKSAMSKSINPSISVIFGSPRCSGDRWYSISRLSSPFRMETRRSISHIHSPSMLSS